MTPPVRCYKCSFFSTLLGNAPPDSENLFVGDRAESGVLEIDLETHKVVRIFRNKDMDLHDPRFVIFVPNPFQ